jgi:hypothetical protein
MLHLIILKLLFNDDKVRSIEALIIDGVALKAAVISDGQARSWCARKNVYSMDDNY